MGDPAAKDALVNIQDVTGQRGALLTFVELSEFKVDGLRQGTMQGVRRVFLQPSADAYLDFANARGGSLPYLGGGNTTFYVEDRNALNFAEFEVEKMPASVGSGRTALASNIGLQAGLMGRVTRWCRGALTKMAENGEGDPRCVFAMETAMTALPQTRGIEPDSPIPNAYRVSLPFQQLTVFFIEKNRGDGSKGRASFPACRFAPQ